ncbi:MAG: caspase family protein [Proteobacteria bacterium]|nr:caspase family protein [Pseudomonadota bacterium]
MYRIRVLVLAALTTVFALPAAAAENRLALVIGNSAYQSVPALRNPGNDAKAMAELLTAAGFEVEAAPDLTQTEMRRVISEFTRKVANKGADTTVVVFFAGHGLQVEGENFLVPVDARVEREADVPLQTLRLADLMNALSTVPSKARVVILDACRNNPFSAINKTGGKGLAIVDAPNGTLVSYSTSPGAEAEDGPGNDSPYTTAFLRVARQSGLPIEQALKRIRIAVNEATDGRQTPWESSSLTHDVVFFTGAGDAPGEIKGSDGETRKPMIAGARPDAKTVEVWRRELITVTEREAYRIVIREDTVEAYEAFITRYPNAPQVSRVRSLLGKRQEMVAWYIAVSVDTVSAYATFLAQHADSAYAQVARRNMERPRARSLLAEASGAFNRVASLPGPGQACQCTPTPAQPLVVPPLERRTDRPPPGPNLTILPPGPPGLPPPVIDRPPPLREPPIVTLRPVRQPPDVVVPPRPPVVTLPPRDPLPTRPPGAGVPGQGKPPITTIPPVTTIPPATNLPPPRVTLPPVTGKPPVGDAQPPIRAPIVTRPPNLPPPVVAPGRVAPNATNIPPRVINRPPAVINRTQPQVITRPGPVLRLPGNNQRPPGDAGPIVR